MMLFTQGGKIVSIRHLATVLIAVYIVTSFQLEAYLKSSVVVTPGTKIMMRLHLHTEKSGKIRKTEMKV